MPTKNELTLLMMYSTWTVCITCTVSIKHYVSSDVSVYCICSVSSETLMWFPVWEGWKLESGFCLVCHAPSELLIIDSKKLIAPAGHYLQSDVDGTLVTCVCYRQATSVCECGGCAMHCSLHGTVWPHLLLWDSEALWTYSKMFPWCLPWLWWAQTGDFLLHHPPLCSIFQHCVSSDWPCFSRCCRKKTLTTTMLLGRRNGESFSFASLDTCVLEESSVNMKTPLIRISAQRSRCTKTWSGGDTHVCFVSTTAGLHYPFISILSAFIHM